MISNCFLHRRQEFVENPIPKFKKTRQCCAKYVSNATRTVHETSLAVLCETLQISFALPCDEAPTVQISPFASSDHYTNTSGRTNLCQKDNKWNTK